VGAGREEKLPEAVPADYLDHLGLAERIRSMRAMTWAYSVLYYTGYTASGASKAFSPPTDDGKDPVNSKIMYQYLRGERMPISGPRGKHGYDLVAAVANHGRAKHADKWLTHSLWKVFDPETTKDDLAELLTEDAFPPQFAWWIIGGQIPDKNSQTEVERRNLELLIFDDFVAVCASHRLGYESGYQPPGYRLTDFLVPQAAILEPPFAYVQAPFKKIVRDFYFRAL